MYLTNHIAGALQTSQKGSLELCDSCLSRIDRSSSVKKTKAHWNEDIYHSFSYTNKA